MPDIEATISFPPGHLAAIRQLLGQVPYDQAAPVIENIERQLREARAKSEED